MNVHRGSESDRSLLQEASCLMDGTSAAAQEKETNSLTSGLQRLAYPLTLRSDGTETRYWLNVEGFLTPEHPLCPEDINVLNLYK